MHNETTTRKRYDEASKRSTVEHLMISGKSVRQVAAELGVDVNTLHNWRKKFNQLPAGEVAGTMEALQAENRRLQRELRRVSVQRDILKKPWASSPKRPTTVPTHKSHARRIFDQPTLRRSGGHPQWLS